MKVIEPAAVVAPVRIAHVLGAETLIMASAVGGMNPQYAPVMLSSLKITHQSYGH